MPTALSTSPLPPSPPSSGPALARGRPRHTVIATLAAVILALVVALAASSPAHAKSLTGDRVLAVLDSANDKPKYSQLFKMLSDRGFQITFKDPTSTSSLSLFEFGERTFDHALLLAPTQPLKDTLSPQSLVSFMRAGGNLLVGLGVGTSDAHKDFVYELGIDVADAAAPVRDYFQADPADATLLAATGWTKEKALVPAALREAGPVLFRGIAHTIVPEAAPEIVFPILSAGPTTAGAKSVEGSGVQLQLVSGVQGKNGARAVVIGSLDMLTDEFFAKKVSINKPLPPLTQSSFAISSNRAFADQLLKWTLHETSIVRIARMSHHKQGESTQLPMYRIKDTLVVNVTLQEYHVDHWGPYLLPSDPHTSPIYFSAKMLDPYLRLPLQLVFTTATSATYSLVTKLPDTYGVFTFAVAHTRPGLSPVEHSELVSIRPFRHDEYPRWLPVAMPYYVASVSQMLASVVLVGLWITRKHVPAAVVAGSAEKKVDADKVQAQVREDEVKTAVTTGAAASPVAADRADASPNVGAKASGVQRRKKKN